MHGREFGMEVVAQPDLGLVVAMSGDLDLATLGTASLVLDDAVDGSSGDVWLDLAEITFMAGRAAEMIGQVRRRMALHGRTLALLAASAPARLVLAIADPAWDRAVIAT